MKGYGFGAIVTTFPIDAMLKSAGHEHTLVVFGVLLGIIGFGAALGLKSPPAALAQRTSTLRGEKADTAPGAMLKTTSFCLLIDRMRILSS